MKRPLPTLACIRMKEYLRRFAGYRIEWRRLFLIGAIMTAAGVVLQMFTLPYPLNVWFLSTPVTVITTSDEHNSSTMSLSETVIETRVEKSPMASADSSVLLNPPTELSETVIESDISPPVEQRIKAPARQRRKSVSRRRKKNINAKKVLPPPPPPPPPRRIIPYRLQKFIWSLRPIEALEYAKKEIEQAPEVTDDPELYAPLFRNVSIFKR